MLPYGTVLLVTSMALGQAGRRAETDDFTKLRGFLGTWEATDVVIGGQKMRIPVSWNRTLRGHFIEHKYMFIDEAGSIALGGLVIFGRDPADGKVHGWGFDHLGGFMAMELVGWDENKSNWSTTFTEADGTIQKSEGNTFEVLPDNRVGWMLAIAGGEKSEGVFKRTQQSKELWPERQLDATGVTNGLLKDMAWWAGNFTTRGSDAFTGKTAVGQSTCGWILGGHFLQYDIASVDGDLRFTRYRAIIGVDPTTGKPTGWEFDDTGTVGKYTVSDKGQHIAGRAMSPDAGLLEYSGTMSQSRDGFEYKATGSLPGGKKTSYFGSWTKRD